MTLGFRPGHSKATHARVAVYTLSSIRKSHCS